LNNDLYALHDIFPEVLVAAVHPPDAQQQLPVPPPAEPFELMDVREVRRATRLVECGQFRKAAALVKGRCSIAPLTPATMDALRDKHPTGALNPFGDDNGAAAPHITNDKWDLLDKAIKVLDPQTSAGISGWTPDLVKHCYGSPEDLHRPFRSFIQTLAREMLAGTAVGKMMLCASRLTPLQATPDKIRPIACGELFYRICLRFLQVAFNWNKHLLPVQLGVGSPGGVEPVLELMHRELDAGNDDRYVYSLDQSNAFNSMSRKAAAVIIKEEAPGLFRLAKWAYNDPTPLVCSDGGSFQHIPSSEGWRQGCPLACLLHGFGVRPKLTRLMELTNIATDTTTAYLDDFITISSSANLMAPIIELFAPEVEGQRPADGLVLNVAKTKVESLANIRANGTKVLGSMVGSRDARHEFVTSKIAQTEIYVRRLKQLPHQHGMLVFRYCIATEHRHLLRTMQLSDLEDELRQLDAVLQSYLEHVRSSPDGEPVSPTVSRVYSLPLSRGGCGVLSYAEARLSAWTAAREAATEQLTVMGLVVDPVQAAAGHIPPHPPDPPPPPPQPQQLSQRARLNDVFDVSEAAFAASLTPEQRLCFYDNGSKCGTAWLHAVPRGGYRVLSNAQVAAALNIRVLQPDLRGHPTCTRCGSVQTVLHSEACPQCVVPRQVRHNCVRDIVAKAVKASGRNVQPEPHINQNNQRADLRVGAADGGLALDATYGFVDFKVKLALATDTAAARAAVVLPIGPLTHIGFRKHAYGQLEAALDFSANECRQHYQNMGLAHPVAPLVVSSGGTLHKSLLGFLKVIVPDGEDRRQVLVDISLALTRARASAFVLA
jgi:hypothetical protein